MNDRSTPTPVPESFGDVAGGEQCQPGDRFFDYLLLSYAPRRPIEGKLRSVNLLRESFALMAVGDEGARLIDVVRAGLGPFRTVWGIKHNENGELSWEIYFYRRDFGGGEPTLAGVLGVLGAAPAELPPMPHRWEVFSLEFTAADLAAGRVGALDVYIGMRAYRAHGGALELKNQYLFADPGLRLHEILERLLQAVHAPHDGEEIARLLPPELLDGCPRVCVANKRHADGLYFSHLNLEQMSWFLGVHRWPDEMRAWVERHAARLDHLLWDAGYDFRNAGPKLEIPRSGLYGFF
jgi:hypothetical protein